MAKLRTITQDSAFRRGSRIPGVVGGGAPNPFAAGVGALASAAGAFGEVQLDKENRQIETVAKAIEAKEAAILVADFEDRSAQVSEEAAALADPDQAVELYRRGIQGFVDKQLKNVDGEKRGRFEAAVLGRAALRIPSVRKAAIKRSTDVFNSNLGRIAESNARSIQGEPGDWTNAQIKIGTFDEMVNEGVGTHFTELEADTLKRSHAAGLISTFILEAAKDMPEASIAALESSQAEEHLTIKQRLDLENHITNSIKRKENEINREGAKTITGAYDNARDIPSLSESYPASFMTESIKSSMLGLSDKAQVDGLRVASQAAGANVVFGASNNLIDFERSKAEAEGVLDAIPDSVDFQEMRVTLKANILRASSAINLRQKPATRAAQWLSNVEGSSLKGLTDESINDGYGKALDAGAISPLSTVARIAAHNSTDKTNPIQLPKDLISDFQNQISPSSLDKESGLKSFYAAYSILEVSNSDDGSRFINAMGGQSEGLRVFVDQMDANIKDPRVQESIVNAFSDPDFGQGLRESISIVGSMRKLPDAADAVIAGEEVTVKPLLATYKDAVKALPKPLPLISTENLSKTKTMPIAVENKYASLFAGHLALLRQEGGISGDEMIKSASVRSLNDLFESFTPISIETSAGPIVQFLNKNDLPLSMNTLDKVAGFLQKDSDELTLKKTTPRVVHEGFSRQFITGGDTTLIATAIPRLDKVIFIGKNSYAVPHVRDDQTEVTLGYTVFKVSEDGTVSNKLVKGDVKSKEFNNILKLFSTQRVEPIRNGHLFFNDQRHKDRDISNYPDVLDEIAGTVLRELQNSISNFDPARVNDPKASEDVKARSALHRSIYIERLNKTIGSFDWKATIGGGDVNSK